jgi:predicted PurR-regulated permease PerM
MSFPPPTQQQARIIWAATTGLAIALIIGLIAGLIWGLAWMLRVFSGVLWPLAVAGVIAYLLDPIVSFLERRKVPRQRGVFVVFIIALALVGGLTANVLPRVITETQQLQSRIPAFSADLQQKVQHWLDNPPAPLMNFLEKILRHGKPAPIPATETTNAVTATNALPAAAEISSRTNAVPSTGPASEPPANSLLNLVDEDTIRQITGWTGEAMQRIGLWLKARVSGFSSFFGILAGLALIPIYAYYFLIEKRGISDRWQDYLPVKDSKFKTELVFVLNAINEYLIAFFRGQLLVALCDGILYTIGFSIIGLPYAVLIGVMATFLTIIPFLGAILTCVSALIIAIVAFGDWQHPLMVLSVFAVVQALEGLVIQPKIMGDRVGLHPVTIIIALMVGTTLLGGVLGGMLAIPLTAALRVVMFRYVWKRRAKEE